MIKGIKVNVKDLDKGLQKRIREIIKEDPKTFSVGIFSNEASAQHDESKTTIGMIASVHEYGLGHVPERSFIRAWFDEERGRVEEAMARMLMSVVEGRRTKDEAFELLAMWCVGQIQKRMARGLEPALSPITIKRRKHGGTKPLIDTGQLRASIGYALGQGQRKLPGVKE